jgi:hypothetical protein
MFTSTSAVFEVPALRKGVFIDFSHLNSGLLHFSTLRLSPGAAISHPAIGKREAKCYCIHFSNL